MNSTEDTRCNITTLMRQLSASNDLMKSQLEQLQMEFCKQEDDSDRKGERMDFEHRLRLKDMQLEELTRTLLVSERKVSLEQAKSAQLERKLRSLTLQRDEAIELSEQMRESLKLRAEDSSVIGGASHGKANDDCVAVQLNSQVDELNKRLRKSDAAGEPSHSEVVATGVASNQLQQQVTLGLKNPKDRLAQSDQIVSQLTDQVGQANQQKTQAEQQLAQANNELQQLRQQLQHRTAELQESQKFSSEIQDFSAGLERDIEALKQQLEESSKKRDDVIKMCEQLRLRFEEDQRQLAAVNSELQRVNFEHTKLRADYSDMERNATAWLAREHELQEKLRHAEEAIGVFKDELEVKEAANAELKERVNRLLEDLSSQEPQYGSGAHVLDRHRASRRPPGGGNY